MMIVQNFWNIAKCLKMDLHNQEISALKL